MTTAVAPVVPSSRASTTPRSVTLPGDARFPGSVEASGRVALQVERNELVARVLQGLNHALAIRKQPRHLFGLDLDSRHVAVVAHAHLPESQQLDRVFGRLDPSQRGDRHLGAVRDARRQARERRLVPVGEPKLARRRADFGLDHAGLEQREPHAAPDRRSMTGPVVAGVIRGGAVREMPQAQLDTDRLERLEQLLLAVEAAVGVVACVGLERELARTATARSPSSSSASFSSSVESTPPEKATSTESRSRTIARARSTLPESKRSSWIMKSS